MAKTEQTTEFVALAKNPVPSGGVCGTFESFDGARLRYAVWQASRGPKAGTVCLFGGRTEFIEKYFEVVADLRRRGFAVATMDWRGQGGSARVVSWGSLSGEAPDLGGVSFLAEGEGKPFLRVLKSTPGLLPALQVIRERAARAKGVVD